MMKISQSIYGQLIQLPCVPPEIGGILGSRENVIDRIVIDANKPSCHNGVYVPNVSFLNSCIEKWDNENIVFEGIFHTHAVNWPDLSSADKNYIALIMNAMPDAVQRLYFPLVFPSYFIKVFLAAKSEKHISITEEDVEIV